MKRIKLTQGAWAIVDDSDYEWLNIYNWHLDSDGYAVRGSHKGEIGNKVRMARQIMQTPHTLEVDHINRNKLDNRRKNLRNCTRSINQINKGPTKRNISGCKNVYWNKREKKWRVAFNKNYSETHIGYFKNLKDAIEARGKYVPYP